MFSLLNLGVGQNMDVYILPIARNFFFLGGLISTFLGQSPSCCSPNILPLVSCVIANAVSHVGRRNKLGHPADSHQHVSEVSAQGI